MKKTIKCSPIPENSVPDPTPNTQCAIQDVPMSEIRTGGTVTNVDLRRTFKDFCIVD
jgi:hypothetical protein